jgi:hypothetical protein
MEIAKNLQIHYRASELDKQQLRELASRLGVSSSDAIRLAVAQTLRGIGPDMSELNRLVELVSQLTEARDVPG